MRHRIAHRKLNMPISNRKALLKGLACSLFINKRITTTLARAKEAQKIIERVITISKKDNTANRRLAFSYLQSKDAVKALYSEELNPVRERNGGYTRIVKIGPRKGDGAEMAVLEIVF
ncbi:ribosomal protein L17 [Thermodesulfobium narugense DSM 14796]|uniref:50S ribosomal protein L17 n=1 Tax=Thermodesulfobium narugense DSM 14796 TaxID=747365 RepID=M1E5B8_9BACT|nr:50S ribosomal protein L17 [Thermodesulfobium narugense]AEE14171.1 ribosomal protein L17 [Thermodesulfobium narugense DSM 14796]